MGGYSDEIMKAIEKHFPDAVDVCEITRDPIGPNEVLTVTESVSPRMSEVLEKDGEDTLQISKCEIVLSEIEPETGIYAAMSPTSHRVYVWIDWRNFLGTRSL